jgi:hypothetical protein
MIFWQPMSTAEALPTLALELGAAQLSLALAAPGHRGRLLFLHFFSAAGDFGDNGCFRTSWVLRVLVLRKAHRAQEVGLHCSEEGSTLFARLRVGALLNVFCHI